MHREAKATSGAIEVLTQQNGTSPSEESGLAQTSQWVKIKSFTFMDNSIHNPP
jgi:hypothetical protein